MAKSIADEAVLFVDDEESILNALKRELADEEYRCLFAQSGSRALGIIQQEKISVIVSDIKMPEMDGLRLLNAVKDEYPSIVRVVLSGYTQITELLVTINQAEVFKFITKPWGSELKSVINEALAYHELLADRKEIENLRRSDASAGITPQSSYSRDVFAAMAIKAFDMASEALISPDTQNISNQLTMASSLLQTISKLDFDECNSYTVRYLYDNLKSTLNKGNVKKAEVDSDAFSKTIIVRHKILSGFISAVVENLTEYPHDYTVKIKPRTTPGKHEVTISVSVSDSRYVPVDGYKGQRTYVNMLNAFASEVFMLLGGEFLALIANGSIILKLAIPDYAQ